jgi:hypothetical protein
MTDMATTRQIKSALHTRFPSQPFSVTHGGERVTWGDDGPTEAEVEDVIISTGLVEVFPNHNDKRYLKLSDTGHNIWFDRYNMAERAAQKQEQDRRRAEGQEQYRAECQKANERAAEEYRLTREFFREEKVPPIPLLRQLGEWTIRHNEKRLPKWNFRFADDFAIQIHPRVTRVHDLLFECIALQLDDLTIKHFIKPNILRSLQYHQIKFTVSAETADATVWTFKPTSRSRQSGQ